MAVATMTTGAAILYAAGIGTAGALYASQQQSQAAGGAAEEMSKATTESTEMQLEYLRETRADIAAAVDAGLIDLQTGFNAAISGLQPMADEYRQLAADPSSIMERPGVQFQFGQGVEALQAGFSRSSGGGVSGPAIQAATEYGQNFASLALDKELARLQPFVTGVAGLQRESGVAQANLRVGGAAGIAGATGQAIPGIASNVTQQGNISAANLINQANIQSNLISGTTGTVSNLAALYALRPDLFSGGGGGNRQLGPTGPQIYGYGGR